MFLKRPHNALRFSGLARADNFAGFGNINERRFLARLQSHFECIERIAQHPIYSHKNVESIISDISISTYISATIISNKKREILLQSTGKTPELWFKMSGEKKCVLCQQTY